MKELSTQNTIKLYYTYKYLMHTNNKLGDKDNTGLVVHNIIRLPRSSPSSFAEIRTSQNKPGNSFVIPRNPGIGFDMWHCSVPFNFTCFPLTEKKYEFKFLIQKLK